MSVKDKTEAHDGRGPRPEESISREIIGELRRKIDAIMTRRESYPRQTVAHRPREVGPCTRPSPGRRWRTNAGGASSPAACSSGHACHGVYRWQTWHARTWRRRPLSPGTRKPAGLRHRTPCSSTPRPRASPGARARSLPRGPGLVRARTSWCASFLPGLSRGRAMLTLLADMAREAALPRDLQRPGFRPDPAGRALHPQPGWPTRSPKCLHLDLLFPSRKLLHRLEIAAW